VPSRGVPANLGFVVERVTRIELAELRATSIELLARLWPGYP
jgi:hypothetical protein